MAALLANAAGCSSGSDPNPVTVEVVLDASDGLRIAATIWEIPASNPPGLVLVHQIDGSRSDWNALASKAARAGYMSIAFDLRGHGDTADLNPDAPRHRGFSTPDWAGVLHDIAAAKRALVEAGADGERIGIGGAGIGANLAVQFAGEHDDVAALVLLSPGKDYKGIRIAPAFAVYGKRPSLLIAGDGDRYSAETGRTLHDSALGFCELREFPGTHHGTALLDSSPNVAGLILQWCDTVLARSATR